MNDAERSKTLHRRLRRTRDRLATLAISAGGLGVIAAVLAIGVFLLIEVLPLFAKPEVHVRPVTQAPPLVAGAVQHQRLDPALENWLVAHRESESLGLAAQGEDRLWLANGTDIEVYDIRDGKRPEPLGVVADAAEGETITAMASFIGGQALIIGDAGGGVRRWLSIREAPGLLPDDAYQSLGSAPINLLLPLMTQRLVLVRDHAGHLGLYQAQTGQRWVGKAPAGEPQGFTSDGRLLWRDGKDTLVLEFDAKHAEVNWKTLWEPLLYEGHDQPLKRWQGAGGHTSESQFGLAPLAWGTLKAAAWAMLFAVPLALGAAIHSATYMSNRLRTRVKPAIELMEALPGVVIGFIAGLLLAPYIERHLAGTLTLIMVLPLGLWLVGGVWSYAPPRLKENLPMSWAGIWLMPWLALLIWASLALSPYIETQLFGGNLRLWLETHLGLDYVQRNAMIVGLAMGFAVIPTIYALAEDALSEVPRSLGDGAQALGASHWQALWHVILPAASPGIISAIMIGAGRAIGETMIVLMATGNAAVMTWSPFEGLRSAAATIAIELPEATLGSTHYRLLFLCALLLFAFTFAVNTLAELVRQRLRRRYRRLGATV